MADGYARASGKVGVAIATSGPGATNLVTGIAQAYLDRSPVLAFTGQLPNDRYEITTHQKLDLRALYAPITKWQARLTARNAAGVVDRALRVAVASRKGPVLIEVPSDVPRQETHDVAAAPARPDRPAAVDPDALRDAKALLAASPRPLVLVGMDANEDAVAAPLRALAEAWRIPVMDLPKAKGVFREDHPLFLGTVEGLGSAKLFELIDSCDLVVMAGVEPVEFDKDWTARARVLHVGPLPNADRYYPSDVELVGPVAEALAALRDGATAKWSEREVAAFRDEFRSYVAPQRDGLTPQEVLAELRAALPEDAVVTCDVGYNKAVSTQCWTALRPRTFFVSNGLSSMGYGLPAAIGLKLAHPERRVACVLGDGGFAMTMAELETAARLRLGIVVVVLADDALSQIKAAQERKGFAVTATTFRTLDYAAIASGFGIVGREATTRAACRAAFGDAAADGPTLVVARIDASAYQLDAVTPARAAAGRGRR
jgi:acetolactate synthase-1/2/3 large subunit